jgi:hypothetical protein
MRLGLLASAAALVLGIGAQVEAGDRLAGELAELTPEAKTKAEALVADIVAGKAPEKAARALLLLGPPVWAAIEPAARVNVAEGPRPWFSYLKALLVPKSDPDFEELRRRVRRTLLVGRPDGVAGDLTDFKRGRPDPAQKGKRLPLGMPAQDLGSGAKGYRSADGTMFVAFGLDGSVKAPDGGDVNVTDVVAGFVAAVGGRGVPAPDVSGRGGNANAIAENGFAYVWGADGADGVKPEGQGGEGGLADGRGGAGVFLHQGASGKTVGP